MSNVLNQIRVSGRKSDVLRNAIRIARAHTARIIGEWWSGLDEVSLNQKMMAGALDEAHDELLRCNNITEVNEGVETIEFLIDSARI